MWLGGNERKIILDEVEAVGRGQILQALWATGGIWIFFFLITALLGYNVPAIQFTHFK